MRHTHKLAVESGATVVFAGDWQVQGPVFVLLVVPKTDSFGVNRFDKVYSSGAIGVQLLNTLCTYFSQEWKVPLWMLVGNHGE